MLFPSHAPDVQVRADTSTERLVMGVLLGALTTMAKPSTSPRAAFTCAVVALPAGASRGKRAIASASGGAVPGTVGTHAVSAPALGVAIAAGAVARSPCARSRAPARTHSAATRSTPIVFISVPAGRPMWRDTSRRVRAAHASQNAEPCLPVRAMLAPVRVVTSRLLSLAVSRVYSIGIYAGASPLALAPPNVHPNPVLTPECVTDAVATTVADPFMIRVDGVWHMFFEAVSWTGRSKKGEIALATSRDGFRWAYRRIVLAEPFHLSYPYVFRHGSDFYMVPESHQAGAVRLYRAERFPDRWVLDATLLSGPVLADTSVRS